MTHALHQHVRRCLHELARPRDEMGQFSDTSDTTPAKMRKAYVEPFKGSRLGIRRLFIRNALR